MPPEDMFGVTGILSQVLIGVCFVVGMIALRMYLLWRRIVRRRQEIERHKDAGTIGPTAMLQGAALPWHYDMLASMGSGATAQVSLDQRVLKPAIGVKLLVLGLCAAIVYYAMQMSGRIGGFGSVEPGPYDSLMIGLIVLVAVNGVLYIFTFETRYDRDLMIVTRMMFLRREYRWKNLWRIADDGAYELHLFFEPGGKAKVLKHSTGIEDFKAFALAQIRRNRDTNA